MVLRTLKTGLDLGGNRLALCSNHYFITFSCLKTWSIVGPRSRHFPPKCLELSVLHVLLWTIFTCRTSLKIGRTTKKVRLSGTFHAVDKISGIFPPIFGARCFQTYSRISSVYTILHLQSVSVLLIELGDCQPCLILHSTQRMQKNPLPENNSSKFHPGPDSIANSSSNAIKSRPVC